MNDTATWLRLRDARLRIGGRLFLRGIDWEARRDEQWAVLGPNGAGKTVLAELVAGRRAAAGGGCWLDAAIDPSRDIGWLGFEAQRELCEADARHDISEYLASAVDEGTTVAALLDANRREPAELARVVAALGIGALLERGLRFLSSGEMRRALLARLLLARPKLAILDAPLEGIDDDSRARILPLIEELLAGSTHVLLLTRRVEELPRGISHVLALDGGRIVASGSRAEVLRTLNEARSTTAVPVPLPAPAVLALRSEAPLLELESVHAHYGELTVLEGLTLRLEAGEHLCIAGPNGCGKSTLLALVCGDNPRAYGQSVRVCGRLRGDGESIRELRRRFGIVSNALHLGYPPRTRVGDVVASGLFDTLGLYEECGPRDLESVRLWLAALGLAGQAGARFDALSFGVQRLVLVARAMIKWPPLLILDEPCSGLDGPNRASVLALVDQIAAAGHTTVLYVSHEHEEMPHCITRRLEFRRAGDAGPYALRESPL